MIKGFSQKCWSCRAALVPRALGQVLLCRKVITINYELLGHWELLVWVFLLLICIQMSWSPSRAH